MVMTFLKWGVPSIIVALVAVAFLTTKTFPRRACHCSRRGYSLGNPQRH